MNIQLTKVPAIVRRLHLPPSVEVSEQIKVEEGAVIVVEALEETGKNSMLEFTSGRVGRLVKGDIIPAVVGKRRALREYSGDIPAHLAVGDTLYLLCESGLVGEIRGINKQWGLPMQVRVLGGVVTAGKQANIKDASIAHQRHLTSSAPILGVVGTCMSIGKTTTICKLIKHFKAKGLKVAAVKLSGVASVADLTTISDVGASRVLGFYDAGLPSTCGNPQQVVEAALGVLTAINTSNPDLVIAEFGDGILGEYNVAHILKHPDIQQHVCAFIVGAGDFVGAWGAKELMTQYGMPITLITGPVANNDTGAQFVETHLGVPAESNQHDMPKTIALVEERLLKASMATMLLASQLALASEGEMRDGSATVPA